MGVPYRPPFPHNDPGFHKCPRLISTDLIAERHQEGIVGNTSELMGMNEEGKKSREEIFSLAEIGPGFKCPICRLERSRWRDGLRVVASEGSHAGLG